MRISSATALFVGEALPLTIISITTQPVGEADSMIVAEGEASAASETLGSTRQLFMWAASPNFKEEQA